MQILRVVLVGAWLWILWLTVNGVTTLGMAEGMRVFMQDLDHPWRAQYNTDLIIHLGLVALWILYREPNRLVGLLWAVLAFFGGSLISLPYLFMATFRARGSFHRLVCGERAPVTTGSNLPG